MPCATAPCGRGSRASSLDGTAEPLPQRVERLRKAWAASRLSDGKRAADFNISIFEAAFHRSSLKRVPADPVLDALLELGIELALQNDNVFDFPAIDLSRSLTAAEVEHVTDRLIEVQTRIEHDERIHDLFSEGLCSLLVALLDDLPAAAFDDAAPFTVPLTPSPIRPRLSAASSAPSCRTWCRTTPDAIAALPFMHTRMQLWQNLLAVSRMTPEQVETAPHKIVGPKDCDLPPPEMIAGVSRRHAAGGVCRDAAPVCHSRRARASSTATSSAAPATARPSCCRR